ncbi:hypothetical protein BDZ89DRAFT_1065305, partial [Hymenopellis radicata]
KGNEHTYNCLRISMLDVNQAPFWNRKTQTLNQCVFRLYRASTRFVLFLGLKTSRCICSRKKHTDTCPRSTNSEKPY